MSLSGRRPAQRGSAQRRSTSGSPRAGGNDPTRRCRHSSRNSCSLAPAAAGRAARACCYRDLIPIAWAAATSLRTSPSPKAARSPTGSISTASLPGALRRSWLGARGLRGPGRSIRPECRRSRPPTARQSATGCSKARTASKWWRSLRPPLHSPFADHEMNLWNYASTARDFRPALPSPLARRRSGFLSTELRCGDPATGGYRRSYAEARTVRPGTSSTIDFPPHAGELVFGFVLGGSATLTIGKVSRPVPATPS